jgi:hypothetical protein
VGDAAASRLAAYRREAVAADASTDEDGEDRVEDSFDGQGQDTAPQLVGGPEPTLASAAAAAAATAAVGHIQLSSPPPSPPPATQQQQQRRTVPQPAMESPDSAVRRIATQRHADMLAQSAAAAAAQHGRPLACGLEELCLRETSVSVRGVKQLLQPGAASSKSLKVLDVSRCAGLGAELDLHPRVSWVGRGGEGGYRRECIYIYVYRMEINGLHTCLCLHLRISTSRCPSSACSCH